MGTHPIFESDFDCLTECIMMTQIDFFTILEIEKIQTKDVVYRTVIKTKKITPKIAIQIFQMQKANSRF